MNTKLYPNPTKFLCPFVTGLCLLFATSSIAQPVLSLSPVIDTGLTAPIQLVSADDGSYRVFIVQQGGNIRAYDSSFKFISEFLTVSNVNFSGERGLLSMAFHPDYENNGFFFVYYVNLAGNLELARYHVSSDSNIADPASKQILITIPHPRYANHNGGELHFGNDGYLYLSTGDGGGSGDVSNNAQNTNLLLGKILRFNVNTSETAPFYTIPADNPYGNPVFNVGLRNPFRWSFDRQTGDMWIGDVGQDSFEEINFRPAASTLGSNYGWHCYEGTTAYNTTGCGPIANYVFPIYTYPTADPSAAITGGIVYRGTAFPTLQGYNISADFFSGVFYKTVSDGAGSFTTTTQTLNAGIADFGETEDGEAYAVSVTDGIVYRVMVEGPLPVSLIGFSGVPTTQGVKLNWRTSLEQNTKEYGVEYSLNGTSFTMVAAMPARNNGNGASYSFVHPISYQGTVFYRLKIINSDGSSKYSDVIRIVLNSKGKSIVSPSIITNGVMNVNLADAYNSLELISMNGTVVLHKNIAGQSGQLNIPIGHFNTGVYTVRLVGNSSSTSQKVLIQ